MATCPEKNMPGSEAWVAYVRDWDKPSGGMSGFRQTQIDLSRIKEENRKIT